MKRGREIRGHNGLPEYDQIRDNQPILPYKLQELSEKTKSWNYSKVLKNSRESN